METSDPFKRRIVFSAWVARANPGERYVYHIGHLGVGTWHPDRERDTGLDNLALHVLAEEALGHVRLTQLRAVKGPVDDEAKPNDEPKYFYIATRTRRDWGGGQQR